MSRYTATALTFFLGFVALTSTLVYINQWAKATEQPVTQVTALMGSDNQERFVLSTSRAFGATAQGLPDPTDKIDIGSTAMENANIFVVETSDETSVYLNATGLYGDIQYWAFPLKGSELIDWNGSSIIYIRNEELISIATFDPEYGIAAQISGIKTTIGGTASPALTNDDIFWTPIFCMSPDDLTSCRYWWFETTRQALRDTVQTENFTFLVIDSVSGSKEGVITQVYVPITADGLEQLYVCLDELGSPGDQPAVCE